MKRKMLAAILCAALFSTGFTFPETISQVEKEKEISGDYVKGQAIVLYENEDAMTKKEAKEALSESEISVSVKEVYNIETDEKEVTDTVALVSNTKVSTDKLVKALNKVKGVKIAEPNFRVKACDTGKYFKNQWHLENNGQNGGTVNEDINIENAPETSKDGKVVAVLDTGVDYTHPDLKDKMWTNEGLGGLIGEYGLNASDEGDPEDAMDENGHGTHCAGVIAGAGKGVNGINGNVEIMALRFLDSEGYGDTAGAIACYEYVNRAVDQGVDVVAINNSWGGEDESEILNEIITKVGEKGVISVCAAGNEYTDYNENEDILSYPACFDNPYIISVAATDENGDIADFSNRGDQYVDIAAPGCDILSSVCDYTYSPLIYGGTDSEEQKHLSQKFNSFDDDVANELTEDFTPAFAEADTYEGAELAITSEENLGDASGACQKISIPSAKADDFVTYRVPYTVQEGNQQYFCAYVKGNVPDYELSFFGPISALFAIDVPAGTEVTYDNYDSYMYDGLILQGKDSTWNSFRIPLNVEEDKAGTQREIVLAVQCAVKGDYEVCVDNIGISSAAAEEKEFGKYDIMSGTSMATPVVTGVVSRYAQVLDKEGMEKEDRSFATIEKTLKSSKVHENLKGLVDTGAIVDFASETEISVAPTIGDVTVDVDEQTIRIKGHGFDKENLKVEVQYANEGAEYEEATILSHTDKEIVLKDHEWINHHVNLKVTAGQKSKVKKYIYLIKGKKQFDKTDCPFETTFDVVTTDGQNVYFVDQENNSYGIMAVDGSRTFDDDDDDYDDYFDEEDSEDIEDTPEDENAPSIDTDYLTEVDPWDIFEKKTSDGGRFEISLGDQLVYADGMLFNLVSLNEIYPKDSNHVIAMETVLVQVDPDSGEVTSLGELPASLSARKDVTMGSYNGQIFFAGGYDKKTKDISTKVDIYDVQSKEWTEGSELPEGRGAGVLLQTERNLVYTFGYEKDGKTPKNLIYDGESWKVSQADPYFGDENVKEYVNRGGEGYDVYSGEVAPVKDGLLYMNVSTEAYGNVFVYNVDEDKFEDTGYMMDIPDSASDDYDDDDDEEFIDVYYREFGLVVGNRALYFGPEYTIYYTDVEGSLYEVSCDFGSHGTVSGDGFYLPGNLVTVKGIGNKGYYCKNLTVDDESTDTGEISFRIFEDTFAEASFAKYSISVKSSASVKYGKTYQIKTTFKPAAAKTQKPLKYTVSNSKYASVSADGVVTPKKAGRGKTVKVKVIADSKVYKTIKIKIKR